MEKEIKAKPIRTYSMLNKNFIEKMKAMKKEKSITPWYIEFESIEDHTHFIIPITYMKSNFSVIFAENSIIVPIFNPKEIMRKLCIDDSFYYIDKSSKFVYYFIKRKKNNEYVYIPIQENEIIINIDDRAIFPFNEKPILRFKTDYGFVNILN